MKNNIRQSVAAWNNKFPLDRWWRKKYEIAYLSIAHREFTFYGMYFEYYEDLMFKEYKDDKEKKKAEIIKEEYLPMTGNWWKGKTVSKEEIDNWLNTPIR